METPVTATETATTLRRHEPRLAETPTALDPAERPAPGGISLLPVEGSEAFAEAVHAAGGEIVPLGPDTRGLIFLDYSRPELLEQALDEHPGITWVQLPYAGIDAMASRVARHAERGVLFTSAKGAYAEPVAEHALTLALALQRLLPKRLRATSWGSAEGQSMYGAKVVILGAGGIARALIEQLAPFRAEVTIVRRSAGPVPGAHRTVQFAELDAQLVDADIVILAAAATDETRGLFAAQRLALLPKHAVLVNIARGPMVVTDDLLAALDAGELFGAALDVTDPEPLPDGHPLYAHERAIVTPHSADTVEMTTPLLAERIRLNVDAFLRTGVFVGRCDPRIGY